MKGINTRVASMKFTGAAVALSFVTMFFILISAGVDWYRADIGGEKKRETLFFQVERNFDWAKKAGDPAFAFVVLAILAYVVALHVTYLRWAGRTGRIPSTWQVASICYGVCSFCLFLAFVIYAGVVNDKKPDVISGRFGGGFGFCIILWLVTAFFAFAMYWWRNEVDKHAEPSTQDGAAAPAPAYPGADATVVGTNPIQGGDGPSPSPLNPIKDRWAKSKVHTVIIGADLFLILLLVITLGAPWYDASGAGHAGLLEYNVRHNTDSEVSKALKKAGDATFFFVLVALLAQLYATVAITLRMLGRNDKFSGRIPHGLMACLISTGISCFSVFLAFCVYAGVINDKMPSANKHAFGGGFALDILSWLFTVAVLVILWFKKDEVDNAPAVEDPNAPSTVYPPPAQPAEYRQNPYGPSGDQYAEPQPGSFLPSQDAHQPPPQAPVTGYDTHPVVHDTSQYDAGQYGDDNQPAV